MTDGPYPNQLSSFMRARGLTDPALAGALGISKQQIFNLRRGHRKLTVEWAKRLAPHLGISWEELITGSPSISSDPSRAELLAAYDAMTDEQRRALLTMVKVRGPPAATPDPPTKPQPTPRRSVACVVPARARR